MDRIKVTRGAGSVVLENSLFRYSFSQETAGLPSGISFADGPELMKRDKPILHAKVNGKKAFPSIKSGFSPVIYEEEFCTKIVIDNIGWVDECGNELAGYRLAHYYEVYNDGVAFVRSFFYTDTLEPGTIEAFVLEPGITLPQGTEANWSYWEFPNAINAKLIQATKGFERNIPEGQNLHCDGRILPFVSFDFGSGGRRDMHCEFFMESYTSLIPDKFTNSATDVVWNGTSPSISWNFQKEGLRIPNRAYQWRNTWGWSITRFPVDRKHPPLRLFHYLDNFDRYPSEEVIREAAEEGANLFMLHENWRLDLKHGEFAYNEQELRRVIDTIHKYGMRTALYVRGNEEQIRYDYAEPMRTYLTRNWDGIYMDFGGPTSYISHAEYSQGGRIQFREYHKMARNIRRFVGEDGLFLAHSGSYFASMAYTQVDAYVSGEQEKGQLIKDRTLHAYFGGLSVSPSSLWTAAFPTYRTKEAVPYLASTAQVPFVILGTQFKACSLDHPKVPSVITFQRPLWRLWELLDGKMNVSIYSTANSANPFKTDDNTGACLITAKGGEALLVVTNFSDKKRDISISVDWSKTGIVPNSTCIKLSADYTSTSWEAADGSNLTAAVDGFGVAGFLFAVDTESLQIRLSRFTRPYPSHPKREAEYNNQVEKIRKARYEAPAWRECYLQVSLPNFANNYEESLWWDLYENEVQLVDVTNPASPKVLGYVLTSGLAPEFKVEERLLPSMTSTWIPLHKMLGSGEHTLVLATKRGDGDFYSFFDGVLSPVPGESGESRTLTYSNAIDTDWALLGFNVNLK
jgi:hypothetical protein